VATGCKTQRIRVFKLPTFGRPMVVRTLGGGGILKKTTCAKEEEKVQATMLIELRKRHAERGMKNAYC